MKLIRSELMKIRTTNVWWLFGIGILVFTAIALALWIGVGNQQINTAIAEANQPFVPPPADSGIPQAEIDAMRLQWEMSHDINRLLASIAANIYTAGQFFGLMFVMLLGAILMTNEFYHQTATATFLVTPQRTKVILAKLGTSVLAAAFFWVLTTAIGIVAGAIFFSAKGYDMQLGEWPVTRAILMNGLAYGLWGILGVALGVLIRNQIAAVIVGAAGYMLGTYVVQIAVFLVSMWLDSDVILKLIVGWPAVASQVMVATEPVFPGSPQWWVGALVLIGYGLVFGAAGTLITRRRDIS
jgi:ABC-2 type transport system permease protein